MTRPRCATIRLRGVATRAAMRDTARAHGLGAGCVAIQATTQQARPATRPATSNDTVEHRTITRPRHGWPGRNGHGLCTHRLGQGVHLVHLTQF